MKTLQDYIDKLNALNFKEMYNNDFFWTWDKTDEELEAVFTVADALRFMRENNISTKVFESVSEFLFSATTPQEPVSPLLLHATFLAFRFRIWMRKISDAHGETVRETANMVSFMADVIGIRDDMYIGKGHAYQKEFMDAVTEGNKDGILEQRPTLVNLQCDVDHPTQCMADMLHIIHEFGGVENLKGKKLAMTWAYSPSYGKPLSVPQGIIGLMTRFGMDVVLAHPEGYEVFEDVEKLQKKTQRNPADLSQRQTIWQKHSKTPISYIRRAGLRSLQWKNVRNCTETATSTALQLWRKNCSLRMQNTKTGLVQKSSWLQQKTEKHFICTVCRLTSQA